MEDIVQYALFGIVTGSILAISSAGFAMIRQTEGFLNLTHGQYVAIGAYLGFVLVNDAGMSLPVGGVLAAIAVGIIGAVFSLLVIRPVKTQGTLVLLFSSVGLAYVLYAAIIAIFGPDLRTYPVDFGARIDVYGSVSITVLELATVALAVATLVGLHIFLNHTRLGTFVRAVASNPDLARVRGVPVESVSLTVWFVASFLAGGAGVLLGVSSGVNTELGWTALFLILAATVVGGLGRIYGVMAAALLLGLAMDLSTVIVPTSYRTAVAFVVLIVVVLVKPEGIFAVQRRREQAA